MFRFIKVIVSLLSLLLVSNVHANDPIKVGFVYVGPVGDYGWSFQHDQARLMIDNEFGDKVSTSFVENVNSGTDAERVIHRMAATGYDIIFSTSFGFMNGTLNVAKKFPKVKFEHATGYARSENMASYNARFYEGRYIQGVIAGHVTKTNTLGYVASFPVPEVIRGINSTYLAAKSVNPDVKLKIIWVNTWYDPMKEAEAAKVLIDQGVDILMHHTDSTAVMQEAEKHENVYGFGKAFDMTRFAPNSHLTSVVNKWAPYYVERVRAVLDGTWEAKETWGGFGLKLIEMAPFNSAVPADVRVLAEQTQKDISSGKFHPFTGPLKSQDGTVLLQEGEVATDEFLLNMHVYVEGIDSRLPK